MRVLAIVALVFMSLSMQAQEKEMKIGPDFQVFIEKLAHRNKLNYVVEKV